MIGLNCRLRRLRFKVLTAKPTLVAIELLQLQDLKAKEQAAAEKHEARHEAAQEAAPRPRQLMPAPMIFFF